MASASLMPISQAPDASWVTATTARDPHYLPAFASLYRSSLGEPFVFSYTSDRGEVREVILIRRLPPELELDGYDAISTYPYGGPIASAESEPLRRDADAALIETAAAHGVVSLFRRHHPLRTWLHTGLPGIETVWRQTFAIDLTRSDSDRIRRLAPARRRNIDRARAASIEISTRPFRDTDVQPFSELYLDTMRRRQAAPFYLGLSGEFLHLLCSALPEQVMLAQAHRHGDLLAAAVFLEGGGASYYFLGGWREDAAGWRPNDLLFWEAANFAASRGFSWLVLGGGRTEGDGLSRFKAGFGAEALPSAVSGVVCQPALFERLVAAREARLGHPPAAHFFPPYRAAASITQG